MVTIGPLDPSGSIPSDQPKQNLKVRCKAIRKNGVQCKLPAIAGGTVCRSHGGGNPAVARKALVRAEASKWGLNDELVDPGVVLLRLVSQSARRVSLYSSLMEQAYQAAVEHDERQEDDDLLGIAPWRGMPKGVSALIGKVYKTMTTKEDGDEVYEASEAIRGLAVLEAQERRMCADFAAKAITAGLAERQVRLAELQGAAIIGAIMAAMDAAGLKGQARIDAQNAASDYLEEQE